MSRRPEKPYTIRDFRNCRVQSFPDYRAAEAAAMDWCREKNAPVPIFRRATQMATVTPGTGGRCIVDMTFEGSLLA